MSEQEPSKTYPAETEDGESVEVYGGTGEDVPRAVDGAQDDLDDDGVDTDDEQPAEGEQS